ASPDGAPEANCQLSAARAQAVHDLLVNEHGVRDERLTPVGLCATDQLIENRTVLFTEPR
ncbi:MAG: OmpA family protein, partial [Acidimicrobiales bacterium]